MSDNFTAVIDTREQKPVILEYSPGKILQSKVGGLYTGDYSIAGLENLIALERKSLDDMMGCVGVHRERFEREITRLKGFEVKAIIVEGSWADIESERYRSRVKATSALGSLMGWMCEGIPIVMADNHKRAGIFIARMLYVAARRYEQRYKKLTPKTKGKNHD